MLYTDLLVGGVGGCEECLILFPAVRRQLSRVSLPHTLGIGRVEGMHVDVSLWTKPQGIHAVDAIPTIVGGENHNTNSL